MARKRYHFDPEQLSLTRVRKSFKEKLTRTGSYVLFSLTIGVAGFFLTTGIITTPREKNLIVQNENLLSLYSSLDQRLDVYDRTLTAIKVLDDSIYRALVGKNPLPWSLREAGVGGHELELGLNVSGYPDRVITTAERIDRLDSHLKVQESSYRYVMKEALRNSTKLNHLPAIMPVSNDDLLLTGSGFGMRLHPILKIWRPHEGIDFFAYIGKDVYATADGRVSDVRFSETFGNVVEIDHGFGIETLYAHLSSFNVRKGQRVLRGNVIGKVGDTGLASGQHLHYEVHIHGKEVDPVNYFFNDLTAEEYKKIVAISQAYEMSMD
ncbi:MAG TPA: M23 family metallopeptidase [Bacteroides sp.]|nr:M23 family metallopeptidase [Bacteroides sp.]